MTAATLTLTDFLLARIAEDEAMARATMEARPDSRPSDAAWAVTALPEPARLHVLNWGPRRVLAECEAKRRIVEFHRAWPVLVESPPTFEEAGGGINDMAFRASQQIAWLTQQEYIARFGSGPPTAPMLAAMAVVYADHEDYDEAWRP